MTESTYPMLAVAGALAIDATGDDSAAGKPYTAGQRCRTRAGRRCHCARPAAAVSGVGQDGYAVGLPPTVRASTLVIGEVTAGRMADFAVAPGSVAYITTGAPLPRGADAVVMVEETESLPAAGGRTIVRINSAVRPGR